MFRENLYDVTVTIQGTDGTSWTAVFDKFKGGAVKGKETKYRAANGLQVQVSLGGATEVDNVTVTRLNDETSDSVIDWLISQCNRATMIVAKQPIDENGAAFGTSLTYLGRLLSVTPPDTDSESDSAALIELEQSSVTVS